MGFSGGAGSRFLTALVAGLLVLGGVSQAPARAQAEEAEKVRKLLDQADDVAIKVAKLRGLAIKRPIKRGVMDKKQITERLLERVRQEYKEEEIRGEELALKRLGLLKPDDDYLDIVLKLLTQQIAGFYDPWEKQLYIAGWNSMGGDFVLAHEIDHALQDQHFNLKTFLSKVRDNSDAVLARQALVEGDGMAVSIEYMLAPAPVPWGQDGFIERFSAGLALGRVALRDVPLVLREMLFFPYGDGLEFVAHFRKHHEWKAIDDIFAKPPLSTEQILHPEKYTEYEKPHKVKSGEATELKGYKRLYDNVLGELGVGLVLQQHGVSKEESEVAAAGWGGDRLSLFVPPGFEKGIGGLVGVLYSSWDEEADAIEFYAAVEKSMAKLTGGKQSARDGDRVTYLTSRGEVAVLERRDDRVLLLLGAPPAWAEELRAGIWKRWKITR